MSIGNGCSKPLFCQVNDCVYWCVERNWSISMEEKWKRNIFLTEVLPMFISTCYLWYLP